MEALQQLRDFVSAVKVLNDEEWDIFSSRWQPFECKRKTVLTAAGETEKHLYFVLEGLQRAFYVGDDQKEATIVFTYPYSFSGVADSFLTQTNSKYFLETLTGSKFLRTTYMQLETLMNDFTTIQQLVFKLTAFALRGVLERQIELQCFSAEEKFRSLLKSLYLKSLSFC